MSITDLSKTVINVGNITEASINDKIIRDSQIDVQVSPISLDPPVSFPVPVITNEKMGIMRMMDILQVKATRYAKSSLLKDVQSFLYNYDPTWTVARVEAEILSVCIARAWVTIVKVSNVDYVKLTPNGFVARGSIFDQLISG